MLPSHGVRTLRLVQHHHRARTNDTIAAEETAQVELDEAGEVLYRHRYSPASGDEVEKLVCTIWIMGNEVTVLNPMPPRRRLV